MMEFQGGNLDMLNCVCLQFFKNVEMCMILAVRLQAFSFIPFMLMLCRTFRITTTDKVGNAFQNRMIPFYIYTW